MYIRETNISWAWNLNRVCHADEVTLFFCELLVPTQQTGWGQSTPVCWRWGFLSRQQWGWCKTGQEPCLLLPSTGSASHCRCWLLWLCSVEQKWHLCGEDFAWCWTLGQHHSQSWRVLQILCPSWSVGTAIYKVRIGSYFKCFVFCAIWCCRKVSEYTTIINTHCSAKVTRDNNILILYLFVCYGTEVREVAS